MNGLAINSVEYVPTTTTIKSAHEKLFKTCPPKSVSDRTARKVVPFVMTVLLTIDCKQIRKADKDLVLGRLAFEVGLAALSVITGTARLLVPDRLNVAGQGPVPGF
jgi:hypothetical protein